MPAPAATALPSTDALELEVALTRTLGAVVGGAALTRALGYPTQAAFRQALVRNRVPVPIFEVEGRRGRFALARDLAVWMAAQRARPINRPESAVSDDEVEPKAAIR